MLAWATAIPIPPISRPDAVSTRAARTPSRNARPRCPTTFTARMAVWSNVCWRSSHELVAGRSVSPSLPAGQIKARHIVRKALEIQLLRKRDIAHVAEHRDEIDAFGGKADRFAIGLAAPLRIGIGAGLLQQILHVGVARVVVQSPAEPIGH